MLIKKLIKVILLLKLMAFLACTGEEPYLPEDVPGKIVGLVKPFGIAAQVDLFQGQLIQSVTADTLTGFFEMTEVLPGVYNMEFRAANYGRHILNEVIVYSGKTTATPDVYLRPMPGQILSITPANNATDISVIAAIEIDFAIPMNQTTVENNFSLQPTVSGSFSWINAAEQHNLFFTPTDQFKTKQTYTVRLNKNATTIFGDTLDFSLSSQFTTEAIKIVSSIPQDYATFVSPQIEIYLTFNSMMDRAATESKIALLPTTAGDFRWLNSRQLSFIPSGFLASNTEYEIRILPGAADIYGTYFWEGKAILFTTEPLKITSHFPANGATYVSRSSPIVITFNTYMDQAKAENSFSLSPATAGWNFQWSDLTRFQFGGTTKLQAHTLYTVKIDSTCADLWNNELPATYAFSFTTGE